MTYTAMDRFKDALKGRPRDRVPVFPLIGGWAATHFSDEPLPRVARDPRLMAGAQIRAMESAGYDALFAYVDPLYVPEAYGCKVRMLETGPLVDPLPLTVTDPEHLDMIPRPDPLTDGRLPVILEAVRRLSDYSAGDIPVVGLFEGPFTTTCRIIEAELVMRMVYKNRGLLEQLLDRVGRFLFSFGRALIENGANILLVPEPTASAAMISPAMFRKLVLPRIQQLVKRLEVPFILHICGDTSLLLETMADTGAHVLSLDQCMDLTESRRKLPKAVLAGNVDPVSVLFMGTEDQVVEDTLRCLHAEAQNPFVLMSGCGVPPKSPVENIKAMVRTAVEYGLGR